MQCRAFTIAAFFAREPFVSAQRERFRPCHRTDPAKSATLSCQTRRRSPNRIAISNLLRGSVVLSLVVIVIGTVVTFVDHPEFLSSPSALGLLINPGTTLPHTLDAVARGLQALQGDAIVTLGLLLLIATPVMRVGISILAFVYERDAFIPSTRSQFFACGSFLSSSAKSKSVAPRSAVSGEAFGKARQ